MRIRSYLAVSAALALLVVPPAFAQLVNNLHGSDGVNLPCISIGPFAPIGQEYCVNKLASEGFLSTDEVGHTGFTVGDKGAVDGVVTAVTAGDPRIKVGSVVVSVNGASAAWSGAELGRMLTFGTRQEQLKLTVQRNGAVLEKTLRRDPAPEPSGTPHSPNPLVGIHPVVDWRGVIIPCMGAGAGGFVIISACQSKLHERGYVKVPDLGTTGLTFDETLSDKTVVATASGPAGAADIMPGDVITTVNGKPVLASTGSHVEQLLFGKIGDRRRVVLRSEGRESTFDVILAKRL